ncbi:MAG: glycoside hydrolase family 30 protein [Terriglobia bacterium]
MHVPEKQNHLSRPFPKIHLFLALMFLVLGTQTVVNAQAVKIVVSSQAGDRLSSKPDLHFDNTAKANALAFTINENIKLQKMDGFGASLLEAGLMCINTLPAGKQEEVLRALFDPEHGAGFSAMKTVIGATDFQSAGPFFTYDDTPGDVSMQKFSIARDLGPNGEITFIKRARRHGSFVLQAPMDYPPDWMLTNAADHKKQDVDPKYYDALALYYLRYLQEYEKNGVFINYLSLFNEPGVYTKINYNEIRELLKNHVGPLLRKSGTKTKIQLSEAPTRENAFKNYSLALDDPDARKYVDALAYHGYDWTHPGAYGKIANVHKKYPQFPMWMTEVCHAYEIGESRTGPMPLNEFNDGDLWGNMIVSDLEAGASGWIYWNMVLDEKGGPWLVSKVHEDPENNAQHPVVIVNSKTHEVLYTGLYYYLAHFSKFVRPGDYRVETTGKAEKVRTIAFKSADGKTIVELLNSRPQSVETQILWQGKTLAVNLPATSITTLTW